MGSRPQVSNQGMATWQARAFSAVGTPKSQTSSAGFSGFIPSPRPAPRRSDPDKAYSPTPPGGLCEATLCDGPPPSPPSNDDEMASIRSWFIRPSNQLALASIHSP